jgi:hypothetical protein
MVEQDPSLASVLAATSRLLGLWRARDLLDLTAPDQLLGFVKRALPQLAYLIDGAALVKEEDEEGVIAALTEVHQLAQELAHIETPEPAATDPVVLRDALTRLRTRPDTAPGVLGAALALGIVGGEVDDAEVQAKIAATFGPGADQGYSLRFLAGLMRAAPDLLLHTPELFGAVDASISALEPGAFLDFLPELRRAFSWLKPFETAQVAQKIAERTGFAAASLQAVTPFTQDDLRLGIELERRLRASLERDGLAGLIGIVGAPRQPADLPSTRHPARTATTTRHPARNATTPRHPARSATESQDPASLPKEEPKGGVTP